MFSLVITVISIALVAALALATLYYGGSQYTKGTVSAQASQVINQSQQLQAASLAYKLKHGEWPLNLNQLVVDGFLSSIPMGIEAVSASAGSGVMPNAHAAATEWTQVADRVPVYALSAGVPTEVCVEINRMASMGVPGVANRPFAHLSLQCFGSDDNTLSVLSANRTASLQSVVADVVEGPVPSSPTDPLWHVSPAADDGGSGAPGVPSVPDPSAAVSISVAGTPTNVINLGYAMSGTVANRTVTVTNTGEAVLSLPANPVSELSAPFSIHPGNCSSASLAVGQSCNFSVDFTPTYVGMASPQAFTVNAGAAGVVNLSAEGVSLGAIARWSETQVDFGVFSAGSTSVRTVTLYNEGNTAGYFMFSPPPGVSVSAEDCATVFAGSSCEVTLTFAPEPNSVVNSFVTLTGAQEELNQLRVTGQNVPPPIELSDFSLEASSCTFDAPYNAHNCSINVRNVHVGATMRASTLSGSGLMDGISVQIDGQTVTATPTPVTWLRNSTMQMSFRVTHSGSFSGGFQRVYVQRAGAAAKWLRISVTEQGAISMTVSDQS